MCDYEGGEVHFRVVKQWATAHKSLRPHLYKALYDTEEHKRRGQTRLAAKFG